MNKGALYLIPSGLSDAKPEQVIPAANVELVKGIKYFIVENIRTARRWIRRCDHGFSFDDVTFYELNRHTDPKEVYAMLQPLREGNDVGVMSEAGCPAVADPGSDVVALAQREGLRVMPLVGPSSILMSLMGSGFNGQSFCFHGYLPIEEGERIRELKRLERESMERNRTQIFIETPYRNNKMIECLCNTLSGDTRLCIAANITDPERESILTKSIADWKRGSFDYGKQPTIFLIEANGKMPRNSDRRRGKKR